MAHVMVMPELGLTMREGLLVRWMVDLLRVPEDCIPVLLACPQDLSPCNGWRITDLRIEVT